MALALSRAAAAGQTTKAIAEQFGVSAESVRDWIKFGVCIGGGERVKLAAIRVAASYRVSAEAMETFLASQNGEYNQFRERGKVKAIKHKKRLA